MCRDGVCGNKESQRLVDWNMTESSFLTDWRFICLAAGFAVVGILFAIVAYRRGKPRRTGRKGERRVRRELRRLPRRDFVAMHDLMLPSGTDSEGRRRYVQVDHVVVSTRGIFVIETKAMSGHIQGNEDAQYWQQRFMMSSKSFYNPLLQNEAHIRVIRRGLRGVAAELFVSAVVFTEAWRIDVLTEDLVKKRRWWSARHIRRTLDPARSVKGSWWRRRKAVVLDESKVVMRLESLRGELKRRPKVLTHEEMEDIAERIKGMVAGEASRRRHVADVRRTARSKERDIRSGICPRCGGRLILREGRTGPFLGCSNYPQCRFTCEP